MTSNHKLWAQAPQAGINDFWSKFIIEKPSKITSIFPRQLYAGIVPEHPDPRGLASARNAADSYEAAAKECREQVAKIVRECYRTNEKFTDPDFDIETDLVDRLNCLMGLGYKRDDEDKKKKESEGRSQSPGAPRVSLPPPQQRKDLGKTMGQRGDEEEKFELPESVHRVGWIFTDPKFTIDGFSSSDIRQGKSGDCWWLAGVATIAPRKDLMNKICIVQNEECGVYGFVFHRDGEWISTVVDDNLYLHHADFAEAESETYDPTGEKARKYRAQKQTGSEALWLDKCSDPNETWLPLLQKAFAKAHGDYKALRGGWTTEAVEDMTGGVTTTIVSKRVLNKDKLWKELASYDGDFLFALSAAKRCGRTFPDQISGVFLNHAYSILHATEEVDEDGNKLRFVKIRNPWGMRSSDGSKGDWNGRWSDGSREWTPYWMKKLNYTFGDDGVFWMLYEDVLETFNYVHRTRLFDGKWTVFQQWTSCDVAWLPGYLRTKFVVDVKKTGAIVLVLAQLDDRYFQGLYGQHFFHLEFLLKRQDDRRVRGPGGEGDIWDCRSVSAEVLLDPGKYEVIPKITGKRHTYMPTLEKIIKQNVKRNPEKLRQVGMQYDLAHAKGGITDEDQKLAQKKPEKVENKPPASTRVQVQVQFDVPKESINWKRVMPDGEGEKFEDAAENLDGSNARLDNGLPQYGNMRKLQIQSKTKPTLPGQENDDAKSDASVDSKEEEEEEEEDDYDSQWNAVCVTCLRVYSQDPDLTISLVQPETIGEEPSSSLVEGQEPAGETQ